MNIVIKELNLIKNHIPKQTYKTIKGQIKSGDIVGARVGIERIKMKLAKEKIADGKIAGN